MKRWHEIEKNGFTLVINEGGRMLGYHKGSGVTLLEEDGWAFKDLNRNGILDPYEDWRLPMEERVRDLAARLTLEQICGLMLYSQHQFLGGSAKLPAALKWMEPLYDGHPFDPEKNRASDLTDQQKDFITNDNLRQILVTVIQDTETGVTWNNNAQALAEGIGCGIPLNISSDPRHSVVRSAQFNVSASDMISRWPTALGLAASFDPSVAGAHGRAAALEYRALGIATSLSPQIDLATEPRWTRFFGTFGEGTKLATDCARAIVDGFQTSCGDAEIENGWGFESVNAMMKHWPGGGSGEGGRDAHYAYGKYAVYPGNNFEEMQLPFTEGAMKLNGPTKQASATMPYYTISFRQDPQHNENVGNSYSHYMITDLLRGKYGFDGVVCTDWGITHDNHAVDEFATTCWGNEHLNENERHYRAIMAGVDQFGGNNRMEPVIAAYRMGCAAHGEEFMRKRFEQSAVRLLRNFFRPGLFDNPYVDLEAAKRVTGCAELVRQGYDAQLRCVTLLKNAGGVLPMARKKVYVPKQHALPAVHGQPQRSEEGYAPVPPEVLQRYFDPASPEEADFAIVFMNSPASVGYDAKRGGYLPISLQYRPYTAVHARPVSIAGGDPHEESRNRSYRGKTNFTFNESDLDELLETRRLLGKKPVIVVLELSNPTVPAEFEPAADAVLAVFGVQPEAVLDVISGAFEPQGLLPCQMPADMETVEENCEDVPRDLRCYTDACGNTWNFGFGMNWSGPIHDSRTEKYC